MKPLKINSKGRINSNKALGVHNTTPIKIDKASPTIISKSVTKNTK